MKRVCVFCGSNSGQGEAYLQAAHQMGMSLRDCGLGLVYGGGNVGLMGALADTVLAGGGEVIGVIPEPLVQRELAHRGCTKLHVVGSMHERKALMADLADAFIALPGGFGTLDEICEVLTWAQLGFHRKPCGLLNVSGFWDRFLAQLNYSQTQGFVQRQHIEMLAVEHEPALLLDRLRNTKLSLAEKWIDQNRR